MENVFKESKTNQQLFEVVMSPVSLASSTTTAEWDKEGTTKTFRNVIYSNTELGKAIRDVDEAPLQGLHLHHEMLYLIPFSNR